MPIAVAAGALAVGALAFLATGGGDGVAPGVTVAGVDMARPEDQARRQVAARGAALVRGLVRVQYDGRLITVMRPTDLGAVPRTTTAIEVARRRSPGFWDRSWRRVTGGGAVTSPLPVAYRPGALSLWVDDLARQIDRAPRSARVVVRGTQLSVTPAQQGLTLDRAALARTLSRDAAAIPPTLRLPVRVARPGTATALAESSAAAGRAILARPLIVRVDGREAGLEPTLVARALRFEGGGARLDPAALQTPLSRAFRGLEQQPRSAEFVVRGERVIVRPAREGRLVDAAAVARGLAGEDRPVEASIVTAQPRRSTEELRALGITRRVGEFTTEFDPSAPRATNVRRGAQILDGTIIPAGGTLSLNEALGQRTRARGFVEAPMIANGLEVEAVGGGVSQVATTLFNAAFFSGLQIVRHTPHQLYISRYPVGREATVSWPEPDLVIRNDWPAAVLVRATTGADSITIAMYSAPLGRRVESETGEPYDQTEPEERLVVNPSLAPGERIDVQGGGTGFSIDVTRTVYRGDQVKREDRFTTVYYADPTIVAVAPGTPGAETLPSPDG
ncbi:MAG: VanW family protein [Thermoleophilia bacterium]|nr:VanW family protein [Thermoleophilia bacterium]